jgi:hypothetical protein
MPGVASLEGFRRAVAEFSVTDLDVVFESSALAEARRALNESGLLLLGEVHGVRENPLLIRALMQEFGLSGLALEWHEDLTKTIRAFLHGGALTDHPLLWSGDGRITAGHLALLRERAAAGPLHLTLFDGTIDEGWTWSQRDEAMASRVLAAATGAGTLAVAGNAHTPTSPRGLGTPLGAVVARHRPSTREIRINYGSGGFYNLQPRRFSPHVGLLGKPTLLHQHNGNLVIDLPRATEAVVSHRPCSTSPSTTGTTRG